MSSKKHEYVGLTQCTQNVKMIVLYICEKETTIGYHHGSAVKLRNTFAQLNTRLVDWSAILG